MKTTLIERWELVEQLLDEKSREPMHGGMGLHPTLYELFTNEAWRDARFIRAGLTYNKRRYIEYEGAAAEAAVCEFLGLAVTKYGRPNAASMEFIMSYRGQTTLFELQERVRRRVQKLRESRS